MTGSECPGADQAPPSARSTEPVNGSETSGWVVYPDSTDELIVGGNLAPVGCGDGPGMGLEGFGQGGEGARGPGWRRRGGSGGIWAGGCPVRAGRGECRDGRRPLGQVG